MAMNLPYFGYGSNLNAQDWISRTPSNSGLIFQEVAHLPDHRLAFNIRSIGRQGGVLNAVPSTGHIVEGCLFALAEDAAEALRAKEGSNYVKRRVTVLGEDGREIEAFTYVGAPSAVRGFVRPHADYLRVCMEGRETYECDTAMLAAAANDEEVGRLDAFFVYGTLMRHELRHGCLAPFGPSCIVLAEARGTLVTHGAYPGLRPGADKTVAGEFIRLGSVGAALQALDAIEGFKGFGRSDNLFRRTLLDVHVGEGRTRKAWTYATTRAGEAIPSGCWREHCGVRSHFREALVMAHAQGYPAFAEAIWWNSRRFASDPHVPPAYDLRKVAEELASGRISERLVAQVSGRWAIVPPMPASRCH